MDRVLKAGSVAGWPRRRISGQEWQAGERAAALLSDARSEAAALLRDAERGLQATREEARRQGHAEGMAQAAAEALKATGDRERWLAAAEPEVIDLALAVARRVLSRELALDPAAVRASAREALAAAQGRRRAALRLHPAAAEALRGEGGALGALAGLDSVELVADAALSPGDAVVETEAGGVDARLEVRLEAFRRVLMEAA